MKRTKYTGHVFLIAKSEFRNATVRRNLGVWTIDKTSAYSVAQEISRLWWDIERDIKNERPRLEIKTEYLSASWPLSEEPQKREEEIVEAFISMAAKLRYREKKRKAKEESDG